MPRSLPAALAAPTGPKHRRWRRWLGLLLLSGVAIAAALPGLLQALVMDQLPGRLAQALDRPVALQAVQVGLWQREIRLSGLQIGPAPADSPASAPTPTPAPAPSLPLLPLLLLPQLRVRLSLQTLRHGAPVIEAVPADGLQFNLARIRLDDRPTGRLHQITDLSLGLPFLSNLPAHLAVRTEPRLAFTLNGTRFDSDAAALPFAQQRQGELRLAFSQLDLAPWLGYLPNNLPLQLQSARVSSDLRLQFGLPPQGAAQVSLLGQV